MVTVKRNNTGKVLFSTLRDGTWFEGTNGGLAIKIDGRGYYFDGNFVGQRGGGVDGLVRRFDNVTITVED